jgi:hypothetical protein
MLHGFYTSETPASTINRVNLIGRTNCPFFTIPADPPFQVVFVNDIVSNLEVVVALGSQTLFEKGEDETAK